MHIFAAFFLNKVCSFVCFNAPNDKLYGHTFPPAEELYFSFLKKAPWQVTTDMFLLGKHHT